MRKRWSVLYGVGDEVVAKAWTWYGAERKARRWLKSDANRVRQAKRGNLKVVQDA